MRDPRLRIFSTILLSAGAFISPAGAVAALLWWLLFTPRLKAVPHPRMLSGVVLMITATAIVSELTGGLGLLYLLRMVPILLIAAWAFSDRQESELLDVSVWMMGKRIGFDIGLMAEMGLQGLRLINQDIVQVRQAMEIKGMRPSVRNLVPMAANIVINQLRRTEETAKLLTVRGYSSGGEIEPHFVTERRDIMLASLALAVPLLSFFAIW